VAVFVEPPTAFAGGTIVEGDGNIGCLSTVLLGVVLTTPYSNFCSN